MTHPNSRRARLAGVLLVGVLPVWVAALAGSCSSAPPAVEPGQEKVRVAITGMTTPESVSTARKALLALSWVKSVEIVETEASVTVDSAEYDAGVLIMALIGAGFGGELLE